MRLVPARIALMKNMAVVPEAEEPVLARVPVGSSAVGSALVHSQGFVKVSPGQSGGGAVVFKECTMVMQLL